MSVNLSIDGKKEIKRSRKFYFFLHPLHPLCQLIY